MAVSLKFLVSVLYLISSKASGGDAGLISNTERPCPGDDLVFTCNVSGVDLIWRVSTGDNILLAQFFVDAQSMVNNPRPQDSMAGFTATLQSRTGTSPDFVTIATLTTTASVHVDGYTILCADVLMIIGQKTIQLADKPAPPSVVENPTIQETTAESAIVSISWTPPDNNGGADINNYTVNISPSTQLSATVVTSTTVSVTAAYSVDYTLSVVATNCAGSSDPALYNFSVPGCPPLTAPSDGVLAPDVNSTRTFVPGATVTLSCNQGFMPTGPTTVVCMDNLMWDPDPNTFVCVPVPTIVNCGIPNEPLNGTILDYDNISTIEGSVITFQCNPGLSPEGVMTATCINDGVWSPVPAGVECSQSEESTMCMPVSDSLGTGAAVALGVVLSSIVSVIFGMVVGILSTYCVMRRRIDGGNKEQTSSSPSPLSQQTPQQTPPAPAGPVYEELSLPKEEIELKTNQAYGPVTQS